MKKVFTIISAMALTIIVNAGSLNAAGAQQIVEQTTIAVQGKNALLAEALNQAKLGKKYVLVSFSTDGCRRCNDLDHQVFKDKILGKYLSDRFVTRQANISKSNEASELARQNDVYNFPTTLVFNVDGKLVGRTDSFYGAWDYLATVDGMRSTN